MNFSLVQKFNKIHYKLLKRKAPTLSVLVSCNSSLNKLQIRKDKFKPGSLQLNSVDDWESGDVLKCYTDARIIYSTFIESHKVHLPHRLKEKVESTIIHKEKRNTYRFSVPLVIENLYEGKYPEITKPKKKSSDDEQYTETIFPFAKVEEVVVEKSERKTLEDPDLLSDYHLSVKEDIATRLKLFNENLLKPSPSKIISEIDLKHGIYEDSLLSGLNENSSEESIMQGMQYGTPNPDIPPSLVPCGGCGATLHCQDEGLPGYIPSERFAGLNDKNLRAVICQRCFFLKNYKVALNIRVSPEVYEKALEPIVDKRALVIVVIDVLDVPCSIWPGIFKLLGRFRPVVVVGNKVDLLPSDSPKYLNTIQGSIIETLKRTNLWRTNIRHVCLTSAKTGFGIEPLVSQIQKSWGDKGDIYIVGCTNAGKSSLFNALLGSDLCKIQASDLIRRATASPWPGTTLNLLKFPILPPSGLLITKRKQRLSDYTKQKVENEFKNVQAIRPTALQGYVGRSLQSKLISENERLDPFSVETKKIEKDIPNVGINERSWHYRFSKWCYDTPGTVQPDQLLSLLTHEELLKVLPRKTIAPRTYSLNSGHSLFIGGLTRLDLLYAPSSVRFTVYASEAVPVTIVHTVNASSVYRVYLGSELFAVPSGNSERLARWPVLKPTNISVMGKGNLSSADIVLSSSGFVTVTGDADVEIDLRGWTPGGRGVYIRDPPMLPSAIKLKGKRIRGTPAFNSHKMYNPNDAQVI